MASSKKVSPSSTPEQFRLLWHFIHQRHLAYVHRSGLSSGLPTTPPTDRILREYRFTNLNRELDRGTKELAILYDKVARQYLPFFVLVSRVINLPAAMREYWPALVPRYDPEHMRFLMQRRLDNKEPIRSNAYMMTTHGSDVPWPVFYAESVFYEADQRRAEYCGIHQQPTTCAEYASRLMKLRGVGSFLAGQIVADIKHQVPWLMLASDTNTFALPGPGSKRGARWLSSTDWHTTVIQVRDMANDTLETDEAAYRVDAQDAQNILCEFDKYMRVRSGGTYTRRL